MTTATNRTARDGFIYEAARRGEYNVYDEDAPTVLLGTVWRIARGWASRANDLPRAEATSRANAALRLYHARNSGR